MIIKPELIERSKVGLNTLMIKVIVNEIKYNKKYKNLNLRKLCNMISNNPYLEGAVSNKEDVGIPNVNNSNGIHIMRYKYLLFTSKSKVDISDKNLFYNHVCYMISNGLESENIRLSDIEDKEIFSLYDNNLSSCRTGSKECSFYINFEFIDVNGELRKYSVRYNINFSEDVINRYNGSNDIYGSSDDYSDDSASNNGDYDAYDSEEDDELVTV